ncbi:MAG: hypothetical protein P4M08_04475 [Oligoflexia bacterium]|nr:hypothetical protein [Oligoflexia bacterium]
MILIPKPGLAMKLFAHTVCIAYLGDSTPIGDLIFNHALSHLDKLFVPKGVQFVPPIQGIGGFDYKNEKTRTGHTHSVINWLRKNSKTTPIHTHPMTDLPEQTSECRILVADLSGIIGLILIRHSFRLNPNTQRVTKTQGRLTHAQNSTSV